MTMLHTRIASSHSTTRGTLHARENTSIADSNVAALGVHCDLCMAVCNDRNYCSTAKKINVRVETILRAEVTYIRPLVTNTDD